MNDNQISEDSFINSIIGEGTRFSGEFDLNGLLRIDGDFCGTIRTKGKVLVGKNGRAECTVYADTVVIGGIVRGNIFAEEKVVILSTGTVLGNISSPRFIVEDGVIFNGNCRILGHIEVKTKSQMVVNPKVEKIELESAQTDASRAENSVPAQR